MIANLVAFERELRQLTPIGGNGSAHWVSPARNRLCRQGRRLSRRRARPGGPEREGVEVLPGAPEMAAAVADLLEFKHKYRPNRARVGGAGAEVEVGSQRRLVTWL